MCDTSPARLALAVALCLQLKLSRYPVHVYGADATQFVSQLCGQSAHKDRVSQPQGSTCLRVSRFAVAYSGRTVLRDLDLDIPDRGIHLLVGPTATGKSTLLRCIAGVNRNRPAMQTWGCMEYLGRPLGKGRYPALVTQNAALLTSTLLDNLIVDPSDRFGSTPEAKQARALEILNNAGIEEYADWLGRPVVGLPLIIQRIVAIARVIAADDPRLLCIDEPTTGLGDTEAARLLDLIAAQGKLRSVILVLHNQRQMRAIGGSIALLAGGKIQERRRTEEFFESPQTWAAKQFVATGSCNLPSPDARAEDLDPNVIPRLGLTFNLTPQRTSTPEVLGPRGFAWLLPGLLGGTPRPGIVADLRDDLEALRRVRVTVLMTLTEIRLTEEDLGRYGMRSYWYPISDMQAPCLESAQRICKHIDSLLAGHDVVAVHCHAGHGRTGTVLAAHMIWRGHSAPAALEEARRIEPRWVQSAAQIGFLKEFADSLSQRDTTSALAREARVARPAFTSAQDR